MDERLEQFKENTQMSSETDETTDETSDDVEPELQATNDDGDDPRSVEKYGEAMQDAMTDEDHDKLPSGDELAGRLIGDAKATVTGSRDTHGDAVENQEHIAKGWTWYLRGCGLLDEDQEITGGDVGRMMPLVKMSRTAVGEYIVDSDRDIAGYAGIAAACEVIRGNADVGDLVENDD